MTSNLHTAMTGDHRPIERLSQETQEQIKSSIQIRSLTDVILELVKNSLDANATHIDIHLDFLKGYCLVLDDGFGILKNDFLDDGSLARLYCTSKAADSQHTYGRYGRFLASLSAVSLLSIASSHVSEPSINSMMIKNGNRITTSIDTDDEELQRTKHGTKIIVHNLFGQMPVRVKHRLARLYNRNEREKEFSSLTKSLVGVILSAQRAFSLVARDSSYQYTHKPRHILREPYANATTDLEYIVSTMFQAGMIQTSNISFWRQASAQSPTVFVQAIICLEPAASKDFQFVSVNQHPLQLELAKQLFDQINFLFDASDFGAAREVVDVQNRDGFHGHIRNSKQLVKGRNRMDRWPIFCIRANLRDAGCRLNETIGTEANKIVMSLSGLLHALSAEFLQSNGFRTRQQRGLRTRKSHSLLIKADATRNLTTLDSWSRIKSGSGLPTDVLSGLPFTYPAQAESSSPDPAIETQAQSVYNKVIVEDGAVEWINPRTGNTLHINSRTGMILPSRSKTAVLMPVRAKCGHQPRRLKDVVSSLRPHMPFLRIEETVRSIIRDHEAFASTTPTFPTSVCECTIGGLGRLHISSTDLVRPACLTITKANLRKAHILGQVDRKFILASVIADDHQAVILLLIDQHAADERVRVEELYEKLLYNKAAPLTVPITFEVNRQEINRFRLCQSYLAKWEVHYSISECKVRVSAVPELIVERCRLEPKLLINLLRNEVWRERLNALPDTKIGSWVSVVGACPQGILEMLASRACRSAIMFNDRLTTDECRGLVHGLSRCLFPFQCAHGRPSLTAVAQFRDADIPVETEMRVASFGDKWRAWNDETFDWN